MSSELSHSAAVIIASAFDLGDDLEVPETISLEDVRRMLTERIITLLDRSPERLMSILYRIDVNEHQVNEIFSHALPPDVPELLANLIIERQLQKVESRRSARS
jgi:hypothetical protein